MASRKFLQAAVDGDLELAKSLLAKDSDGELLNCVGDNNNTALMSACAYGHEQVVRYLITQGCNANCCNNYDWTPLMIASYYGHYAIVAFLVNFNDPNHTTRLCSTPLQCAASCNHLQVADLLISKGAELNASDEETTEVSDKRSFSSPLMAAVKHGHDSMVSLLLSKGADVNYKQPLTGWTPLMMAALKGHTTAVQILIKNGANCNEVNNLGLTALEIAMKMKRKDVENVLRPVTTARTEDAEDLSVDMDLVEVARQGKLEQMKELSKKSDFNVNEASKDGVTALMCAAAENRFRVVLYLLEKHADVNIRDKSRGWTALMYATEKIRKSIVCLLIFYGADVNLKTFENHTAFDMATVIGDSELIRILVTGSMMTCSDVSYGDIGISHTNSDRKTLLKMLSELLVRENLNIAVKDNPNCTRIQFSDTNESNKQSFKVFVSKHFKKLWNLNRTARSLGKKQSSKPRSYQSNYCETVGPFQIDTSASSTERISTVMTESSLTEGFDQRKSHLPLAGPALNLWCNELNNPVVPPFMPTTTLGFETKQRKVSDSLSTSPPVCGPVYGGRPKAKNHQFKTKSVHDSDYYSLDSRRDELMSPTSSNLPNPEEQSPNSSLNISSVTNPNSLYTGSTNTRFSQGKRAAWSSAISPSHCYRNNSTQRSSFSPPSMTSSGPSDRYFAAKTNTPTAKQKSSSLPRIGRSSVAPEFNPRGLSKSEPDEEEMKQLLAKLSLEKYTPILEEHEINPQAFAILDEDDLDEIGIDHDESRRRILDAVEQLKKEQVAEDRLLQENKENWRGNLKRY